MRLQNNYQGVIVYRTAYSVLCIITMSSHLVSMYAMEREAKPQTAISYQQPHTTLSDLVSLGAEDQSSAPRGSLSSIPFPSHSPSEQVAIDIEDFGHDIQQEAHITVAKILQCANVQIPQNCHELIQKEIDDSKLKNFTQYHTLLAAISNQHRGINDTQSQQAATLFLLDVLGRGIETYKNDLRENQERSEGQRKTISRQKAVIIGSVITAVVGGAATIVSAAITAYFAAHNNC